MNRYDDQARLVFHYAREEGHALGHHQVGPEHLLLGLLRTGGGAREVLEGLGAGLEPLRVLVQATYPNAPQSLNDAPSITPSARQVMETATEEARRLGSVVTSTPHILLGLLALDSPSLRAILARIHLDLNLIRARAEAVPVAQEQAPPGQRETELKEMGRQSLQDALNNGGVSPGGIPPVDLVGIVLTVGDSSLQAPFEELLARWLIHDPLPEEERAAVLHALIAGAWKME
ncbi:Clp protease N-terminal domain-containing protein [Deinococcus puniceus]|uniref:Clp R domain-containing protein n=1 Tax=Deinococcus puniceus TaxID=1182568 RepID=A0A172T6L0_9DEIO|nr:Clp protease N-terminal domain-containing protein [Deinococcus puniceus]ANE42453.1 hypothetical protein SU48_00265 [Deinococcus puniceus]